jgi:hypothetical protein
MNCTKCGSTAIRNHYYGSVELDDMIDFLSCFVCGQIIYPPASDQAAPAKKHRTDITLAQIVRQFPDRIEGIKQENGWDAVLNWIKGEFGINANRGSLIASYCSASGKAVYPADAPVKEHIEEIKKRRYYGVGYETIARWLKEQTGITMSGKGLQRSMARVGNAGVSERTIVSARAGNPVDNYLADCISEAVAK